MHPFLTHVHTHFEYIDQEAFVILHSYNSGSYIYLMTVWLQRQLITLILPSGCTDSKVTSCL
jgi:hypothetical protein